jgi:ParB family chromosome partitioning protein
LVSFKNQKRHYFDGEKLKSLAKTIKEHGIGQPLTVIQSEDKLGVFEIVSGECRFFAAKMTGLDKVPCIIIHDRNAAEEIAVIENVQRADLHPLACISTLYAARKAGRLNQTEILRYA